MVMAVVTADSSSRRFVAIKSQCIFPKAVIIPNVKDRNNFHDFP